MTHMLHCEQIWKCTRWRGSLMRCTHVELSHEVEAAAAAAAAADTEASLLPAHQHIKNYPTIIVTTTLPTSARSIITINHHHHHRLPQQQHVPTPGNRIDHGRRSQGCGICQRSDRRDAERQQRGRGSRPLASTRRCT